MIENMLVRAGALSGLDDALEKFGLRTEDVLGEIGLDAQVCTRGDLMIGINVLAAILQQCASVTKCSYFPLRLAQHQNLSTFGSLGLLFQTAENIGESLNDMQSFPHVQAQPVIWAYDTQSDIVTCDLQLDVPAMAPMHYRHLPVLGLAHFKLIVDALSDKKLKLDRVSFRQDKPKHSAAYAQFFDAPVEFGASHNRVEFPRAALKIPVVHSNVALHDTVRAHLSSYAKGGDQPSYKSQITKIVRSLLPTKACTIEHVAKCLGCDKRTLQRRLRTESDMTFKELLDEVRFDTACQYFLESNMPITQIAYAVGYSNPSNFARAFRRKFGCSAQEWRKKNA